MCRAQERDQQDARVLEQKMAGLRISHTRRGEAMDAAQIARVRALKEKCAAELEELKAKQKKEYDILVRIRIHHRLLSSPENIFTL